MNKGKTIRVIRRCIYSLYYLRVGAVYSRGYCAAAVAVAVAAAAAAAAQGSAKTGHLAVG